MEPESAMTIPAVAPKVAERANFVFDADDIEHVSLELQALKSQLVDVEACYNARQEEIESHKREIIRLNQLASNEQARKKRILDSMARNESLLKPSLIRQLPAEILSEIFLCHIDVAVTEAIHPSDDRLLRVYPRIIHKEQNVLLHICRRWRKTAISDPRIWRAVPFEQHYGRRSTDKELRYWQLLDERIRWSGSVLLDLQIHLYGGLKDISTRLITLMPRARSLHLGMQGGQADVVSCALLPCGLFKHVKKAYISVVDGYAKEISALLASMPNVEMLDASHAVPNTLIPLRSLSQLRILRVRGAGLPDLRRILTDAPSLTKLVIHHLKRNPKATETSIITHNHLEQLSVEEAECDFLDGFTFPALHGLYRVAKDTYDTSGTNALDEEWPSHAAIEFFKRSQCTLTDLTVLRSPISPAVLDILRMQDTSLTCLELSVWDDPYHPSPPIPTSVFDFLGAKPKEAHLLKLDTLTLAAQPNQIQAVQRMLSTRLKGQQNGTMAEMDYWRIEVQMKTSGRKESARMKKHHQEVVGPVVKELELGDNVVWLRHAWKGQTRFRSPYA